MTQNQINIIISALLHDIGKVAFTEQQDIPHSENGIRFLESIKDSDGVSSAEKLGNDIINAVRNHHNIDAAMNDESAILVNTANTVANSINKSNESNNDSPFMLSQPLKSIFDKLNCGAEESIENSYYKPAVIKDLNFPNADKQPVGPDFYKTINSILEKTLSNATISDEFVNELLFQLESCLSYIPADAINANSSDVSLFDHLKLTAAIASCLSEYLKENNLECKSLLNDNLPQLDAFLLLSIDFSGIQKFIYTIVSKGAMKTLRSRSFYLEIMMEHIVDTLLEKLNLSRANVIYTGGGHCYMLSPNTQSAKEQINDLQHDLNTFLMDYFDISLYAAFAFEACSQNTLSNIPEGSYSDLFVRVGEKLSDNKSNRYTAEQISSLNNTQYEDYSRECKVCRRFDKLSSNSEEEGDLCTVCSSLWEFSNDVLEQKHFAILDNSYCNDNSVPLPFGCLLVPYNKCDASNAVRIYSKNSERLPDRSSINLWVGDYCLSKDFKTMAENAHGISRIGVIRADVDNLGQTFVSGFSDKDVCLSRTSALSRQLSMFFKYYVNHILTKPEVKMSDSDDDYKRNATICYSGGDDLFIVGGWDDIIGFSVDLDNKLQQYTNGKLTISGGIGVYPHSYPIHSIAQKVELMEEESKNYPGKSAITLFEDGCFHYADYEGNKQSVSDGTYNFNEFKINVLEEKLKVISNFFGSNTERGKGFLYRILELIRNQDDKINFARFVYLISRLEPSRKASDEEKNNYKVFSKKMFEWIQNESDVRSLKTAINIYAYLIREEDKNENY